MDGSQKLWQWRDTCPSSHISPVHSQIACMKDKFQPSIALSSGVIWLIPFASALRNLHLLFNLESLAVGKLLCCPSYSLHVRHRNLPKMHSSLVQALICRSFSQYVWLLIGTQYSLPRIVIWTDLANRSVVGIHIQIHTYKTKRLVFLDLRYSRSRGLHC